MKTRALLAFFFFFSAALFAITTAEIVYDSLGHPLLNGGNYSLATIPRVGGKNIIGAEVNNSNGSCSLAVVAKLFTKGWLTNIASPSSVNITTESALWISFAQLPLNSCTNNPKWVVTSDPEFEEPVVMVGVAEALNSGCFYIKPNNSAEFFYKLDFCCEFKCGHVGVKADSHGNNRLVVKDENEEPLVLAFVKETSDEVVASDISMVV
ncbi:hypothetical protein QN277_000197 [Acacia crassicarpa]|uniref:Uncharacterized protein n=1 Tax=Acacia crassicarpa TaxID=499986 RepID=A0AAE1N5R8_9FABA|nr:hypothetical protein QN277_000197 [Acacia crassicarpa]